jgi:K+-transporting ATPase ATPase B chain
MSDAVKKQRVGLFSAAILRQASWDAVRKLSPMQQVRNPVMFVVYIGSIITSCVAIHSVMTHSGAAAEEIWITIWLWFTVIFANFAEAAAEGRGKAQADSLRKSRKDTPARRLSAPKRDAKAEMTSASQLANGDLLLVEANEVIPSDGTVVEGVASVDESAITGESAPVIRESGGDRSSVTGGTRVLSDYLIIQVTAKPGETFLDRMISMVEGARRGKTPNEIALGILLAGFTIICLLAVATLQPFSVLAAQLAHRGTAVDVTSLVALLVCLIPTTIGGLLSAIGIAGMNRMVQAKVIATSGRCVEAAGDVDVLLLDKTGTITMGNREAVAFHPAPDIPAKRLADMAQLSSLTDETPEGRSVVKLAKREFGIRERDMHALDAVFVPFSAQTRMSGVDIGDRKIRKGAADAVSRFVRELGGDVPKQLLDCVADISRRGGTPLMVAEGKEALGVIELKDIVKRGIKQRFADLRRMGIRTVMVTGDNPLTAAAIAAEAGVDDFVAEALPESKLKLIREYQSQGRLVAMTGDGSNDAPALAQADVAVAMNTGTQAAKEAANMIDLDSNPTKLIEVVETGKQLLMTRGALTTFSVANDVAKYFAIIPVIFATTYPQLSALNIMHLNPHTAILSAVIFNALIIIFLIPIALRGVQYRAKPAAVLLRDNLLIYGLGGLITPFIGIKMIDVLIGLAVSGIHG